MSLLIDEYGRPIILFDAKNTKQRVKGVEAYRVIKNQLIFSQISLQQEEFQQL